ncbi:MAG TPA: thioredoxin domain-containing protein [Patescibacteria group bacterium]|nr:thioredoxin domain-containing protein [Patescibacteria group bacterium]
MNKKIVILFIFAILVVTGFFIWQFVLSEPKPDDNSALADFAQCLSEKGLVMYGANWCSHCQREKSRFGEAFQFVNYVECPQDPENCLAAGIEGYPTWVTADGQKYEGEQGLERLSQISGCELIVKD